jgi:hypothetical protein
MMPVELEKRMRRAASMQRRDVLDTDDRRLPRDLFTLLGSADIYFRGIPDDSQEKVRHEVAAFESALEEAGVHTVPRLCKSLDQALQGRKYQELTLKFDEAQFDAAEADLRDAVLELTTWSPGAPPARVFVDEVGQTADMDKEAETSATVTDAAGGLCLICVPRERLTQRQRSHTFDVLHLVAPRLSAERLDRVESCLCHIETEKPFDGALHPGLTGADRIGVVPLWPDPAICRQRWAVAAGRSWVFAAPAEAVTSQDTDRIVRQMVPRWERTSLPKHGAALSSVLVEVAIESAARRAQALGRSAEEVFRLRDGHKIRTALDGLAEDLAELNAGLDELEVAAADSRTDLERKVTSSPAGSGDASLYGALCHSLEEALAKLERQQQRLQGSFLAACEHASSHHMAETVEDLRRQQQDIAEGQRATDELNRIVGRLTIMLLGPTIVFGALSVTDHWLPPKAYAVSVALLVAYVFAGLAVSLFIRYRLDFFTRLFTPRASNKTVRPSKGK